MLLLDEPTAHLDPATEARVLDAIVQRARRGDTVVVVGHRAPVLAIADQIVECGLPCPGLIRCCSALALLRPRLPRLLLAILCGVLSLGSALALAGVSAWLITRAWQMPPVLDLSIAVVAVRAFGISRGVLHYCERLASHDTALRAGTSARSAIYARLAHAPTGPAARLSGGDLAGRLGSDVDELSDVLVRAVLPIAVAVILSAAAVTVIALISPAAAAVLAGCLLVAGVFAPWLSARGATGQEELARAHHSDRDVAAMLALEHAPELRISGRLPAVIAEADQRQRDWAHAPRPRGHSGRFRRSRSDRGGGRQRARRRRRGNRLVGHTGPHHGRHPDVVAAVGIRSHHRVAGCRRCAHPVENRCAPPARTRRRPRTAGPAVARARARRRHGARRSIAHRIHTRCGWSRHTTSTCRRARAWQSPGRAARARPPF